MARRDSHPPGRATLDPEGVAQALQAARVLVSWGVPIFLARPALVNGAWDPLGGHQGTGYWLPRRWQLSTPDPRVVDRWRPRLALCAVMGHGLDLLDVDPRNGGEASRRELADRGICPPALFEALTPSGGTHEFVAPLGIRSRNNFREGLDVKAGVDGTGLGFAFIAPTIRRSKTTGELERYKWTRAPSGPRPDRDDTGSALAALIEQDRRRRPRRSAAGRASPGVLDPDDRLAALSRREPPCRAMTAQVDVIAKQLANGGRHDALLGPLLRLVGLAKAGHLGLRQALDEVEADFVTRLMDARSGGQAEAMLEFQRTLAGALEQVLGADGEFPRDGACDCFLTAVRTAARDPSLFSRGSKGLTERRVLAYLHLAAQQTRSRVVRESQRQIAVAAETSHPVVGRALRRLEDLGWLRKMAGANILTADPIRLLLPAACTEIPTDKHAGSRSTTASLSVGITLPGRVHRLFGPKGLRPGAAETFAALSERPGPRVPRRSGPSRGRLIQVVPGSRTSDMLMNPWQGPRQIPRPAHGGGRTIQEIAQLTDKNRSTVSRHLKQLRDRGLVIEETTPDGRTVWWRLRFDPDQIADRDLIPDTAEARQAKHKRERRAFLLSLSQDETSHIKRVSGEVGTLLVDARTGEVLDVLPDGMLGRGEDRGTSS